MNLERMVRMDGTVVSIHIAKDAGEKHASVSEARAVAGYGLEGDRYFGAGAEANDPGRELTLIESESIEALKVEHGVELAPGDARRNVVTQGVALNDLVGREFTAGEVRLRGIRLNEPCDHLAGLTDRRVLRGLVHRGGLRAQIVGGGTIRVGDRVVAAAPVPAAPEA
jgi:MOSC domain-containing protein YiiM